MRLLVLGGTWFLGRALAEEALRRGHAVTTFNRGKSGNDVLGVELVRGDREDIASVERLVRGRAWDAVVDTSGFVPRVVRASAREVAEHVDRYVFVSTVSAYRGWPVEPLYEESPTLSCPPDAGPDYGENDPRGFPTRYGYQKAGCESAIRQVVDRPTLILRPGVIVGPYDYVGRLPWWLRRIARGGRVLAPGRPGRAVQPVDVRDVASFVLCALEDGVTGTFNVAAPQGHATYGSLFADCIAATGADAELVWVDDDFLLAQGVRQWTELPLWWVYAGTWKVAVDRARAVGLACRPLTQTVRDTWAWLEGGGRAVGPVRQAHHGIAADREQEVLAAWDTRAATAR